MCVCDRDAEPRPVQELYVVLAVPERDGALRGEAEIPGEELEAGGLGHAGARELEEERKRLRDVQAAGELLLQTRLEPVEHVGLVDCDELRRRLGKPAREVADRVERKVLKAGVAFGLRRHLGDVELVVYIAVDVESLVLERRDRRAGGLERDRLVAQELAAGGIGPDGPPAADDRLPAPGLLQMGPARAEHPAGDDEDAQTGLSRPPDRRERSWPQCPVLPDECPVEVAGEDVEVARKSR